MIITPLKLQDIKNNIPLHFRLCNKQIQCSLMMKFVFVPECKVLECTINIKCTQMYLNCNRKENNFLSKAINYIIY